MYAVQDQAQNFNGEDKRPKGVIFIFFIHESK